MPAETPRDQPTNVATEDAPRPPDNSVVTSDTPQAVEESRAAGAKSPPAAAASDDGTKHPDSAAGDKTETPKRKRSAERRIAKLSGKLSRSVDTTQAQARRINELETENQHLRDATPETPEPKLEDFKSPQEYAKAYSKWQKPAAPSAKKPPAAKQPADPTPLDPVVSKFHKDGRKLLGDEFDEALEEEGTAISQVMAEYLFDDEEAGPAIYVHLANNQDESREIFDMSAPKALAAMEELRTKAEKGELDIEGALQIAPPPDLGEHDTGDKKPPAKTKAPGKTKAPPPPSSTREPGDANLTPDPESEGMEEYANRRNKEIMRARGIPV